VAGPRGHRRGRRFSALQRHQPSQPVINEIKGKTSDGSKSAPVPTILGLNFQEVSVGQKLPVGGYKEADGTPSALLEGAMAHVDGALGRIASELKAKHLYDSTLIIISAKHGQSPIDLANSVE
jgi:arylsulfatase A-like enzyme